jgi:Flp pilus assembly protein CpaB
MKTRIFTMTLVVLFGVASIAGASNNRIINSDTASGHENTVVQVSQKIVADNALEMTTNLEEWITSRESWEQDGQETVTDNSIEQTAILEEWIISRDKWEQEGEEMGNNFAQVESPKMEEWIANIENWEQR